MCLLLALPGAHGVEREELDELLRRRTSHRLESTRFEEGLSGKPSAAVVKTWKDGTLCGLGTCAFCKNGNSWWQSKFFQACGTEPAWEDGSICALGTCDYCKNAATWWPSKVITACGVEPCWKNGLLCSNNLSCKHCCSHPKSSTKGGYGQCGQHPGAEAKAAEKATAIGQNFANQGIGSVQSRG